MADIAFDRLKRSRLKITGLCCCLAFFATSCNQTTVIPSSVSSLRSDYEALRQEASHAIRAEMQKHNLHGISIALMYDQTNIWTEGFGYSDKAESKLASGNTIYQVGSITKPITALAIMQLAEKDEIDIDHPLQAYIPGFNIRSRFTPITEFVSPFPEDNGETIHRVIDDNPITLRNMLSHHSGLPSDINKGMYTESSLAELIDNLKDEYTAYPPDLVYSYSNIAYSLLGYALESETKSPYEKLIQQKILSPLQMTHSSFQPLKEHQSYLAIGYKGDQAMPMLPMRDKPATGLYSTANDLSHFVKMLLAGGQFKNQELIMQETLEEMFEVQNKDVTLDLNVHNGLGWFIERHNIGNDLLVRHAGTTLLHNSEIALLPHYKLGVVVLSNDAKSRRSVARITRKVLNIALKHLDPKRSSNEFLVEDFEIPIPKLGPIAKGGGYSTQFGLLQLSADNSQIEVEGASRKQTFDLIPRPNGWFELAHGAAEQLPKALQALCEIQLTTRLINHRYVMFAKRGNKTALLGEQIPSKEIPFNWLERLGNYSIINPDKNFPVEDLKLQIKENQLWLSYRMPLLMKKRINLPLVILNNSEAVVQGLGRTRGETIHVYSQNQDLYLRFSGYISQLSTKT